MSNTKATYEAANYLLEIQPETPIPRQDGRLSHHTSQSANQRQLPNMAYTKEKFVPSPNDAKANSMHHGSKKF